MSGANYGNDFENWSVIDYECFFSCRGPTVREIFLCTVICDVARSPVSLKHFSRVWLAWNLAARRIIGRTRLQHPGIR